MSYPFQQPSYGPPPGLGGFPGANGAPPGMAPPPGMGPPPGMSAVPGMAPPPGVQQANMAQNSRPNGLPASFQAPHNMPNINFSAPVIRLGTGPSKPSGGSSGANQRSNQHMATAGGRAGLGMERGVEQQRQAMRDSMMALAPPTKDEIIRTVFVGGITDGAGGDEGIERILCAAGKLRRWDRAVDANGKECTFGFAQYDDADSLATAVELFKDIEIPTKKQHPSSKIKTEEAVIKTEEDVKTEGDIKMEEDDTGPKIEKSKLLVFVDDNSLNYLEQYQASRGDENASAAQHRLDSARANLKSALHDLFYPPTYVKSEDHEGDSMMHDVDIAEGENVEVVNIPLPADDELADIPAEMRETVAQEIAAFRDRSNRRDQERLRREEELEAQERQRGGPRNRLASPPPNTPSGPAAGTNNIPLGPRDRGLLNAPSGPKFQGQQIPRDYQRGVNFVNGSSANGVGEGWTKREDEDSDASDEELERRRLAKRDAEFEKLYLDQERRWLNRERSRTAAVQRELERDEEEAASANREKEAMAQRLKDWNDDLQASRKVEEYYSDHSMWIRNRAAFRNREALGDKIDRENEEKQLQRMLADEEQARGMADSFLNQQAEEMASNPPRMGPPGAFQQPFKLSFGAAAQKAQKQVTTRRTVAEVEGLLEDEEEVDTSKRTLIPIKFDSVTRGSGLSDEERDQAIRQLAAEIPNEKDGLWSWDVKWDSVDESVIGEKLRPFVEKKIVEYLGVQEQLLVEVVEDHLRKRGGPTQLVEQLEGALDEEAEVLVKKLWRMLIFFSESERRGLSA